MMAKRPEERFQTPAAVAAALASIFSPSGELLLTADKSSQTVAGTQSSEDTLGSAFANMARHATPKAAPQSQQGAKDWRLLLYTVAGGVIILAGALILVVLVRQPASSKTREITKEAIRIKEPDRTKEPKKTNEGHSGETPKLPPEVFQDFESGSYGEWRKTGTAFGEKPATGTLRAQQAVTGYGGKYLVNTFLDGDRSTGTLTSPEFTVKRPYISFRIGGGNHQGKTCINLLVADKVVRTATGKNNERLNWHFWDVSEFKGQKAVIEIVDRATGPWGHINIDDIEFADDPQR